MTSNKPFEDQYYFVTTDVRPDTEDNHIDTPVIQRHRFLNDDMYLRWYDNAPIHISRHVSFQTDDDFSETDETFAGVDILYSSAQILLKKPTRNAIMSFVPPETQWFQAHIVTSTGKVHEDWWGIHVWKLWDCWDRERSEQTVIDGELYEDFEKLYLDEKMLIDVPEEKRLMIHLDALDNGYFLLHEKVVKILLERQAKGVLFVPFRLFGPGISWWLDNAEEINRLHPW